MNPIKKTFSYGSHQVTLETGEIARQVADAKLGLTHVIGLGSADGKGGLKPLRLTQAAEKHLKSAAHIKRE